MEKQKKKISKFRIGYIALLAVLLILAVIAVIYVISLLNRFESSQPERLVEARIAEMTADAKNGTLWDKYTMEEPVASRYEPTDIKKYITEALASGKAQYKIKQGTYTEDSVTYSVVSEEGNILAEVDLSAVGKPETKLVIFPFQDWKVNSVRLNSEPKTYTIYAPADFSVRVNGIAMGPREAVREEDGTLKYTVSDLYLTPEIVITSPDGKEAQTKKSGTTVKTVFYDYSLTLPSTLSVMVNGKNSAGSDVPGVSVKHTIRTLEDPEIIITDLYGNSLRYDGTVTVPLTYCTITASNDITVTVDGIQVPESAATTTDNPEYQTVAEYVSDIPRTKVFNIAVLNDSAEIVSRDRNGNIIEADYSTHSVNLTSSITGSEMPAEIAAQVDPLQIGEDWSLLMSADTEFWAVSRYLIEGSDLYNAAYQWATSIDITFTSIHYLKTPPFTNESVTNFRRISDSCFSVDVSFDKNMVLDDGRDLVDSMNSRFYFVNTPETGNTWKLVQIKELLTDAGN
jgi:hypothetical protein